MRSCSRGRPVGLRGCWLDRLGQRFTIAAAALINGAAWAVWHAPFVALPGYYADTAFDPALWWLPQIVADTVLYVWLYQRTRRRLPG